MGLGDALEKAWADYRAQEPAAMAARAGVPPPDKEGRVWLTLIGHHYAVLPDEDQVMEDGQRRARPDHTVLVLHYLAGSMGVDPKGTLISFRELSGGDVYYTAFEGRSINRLKEEFGDSPGRLVDAVRSMGFKRSPVGDVGVVVEALPKVPVTVAVWQGDDEVPSSANILFDETIRWHLPTEDVAVLSGLLAGELIRRAPEG